ncbi:MAG: AbrB/MazE/SpoVT family DNA-binding domain-containing protein [Thaumarchaeota archaeon]|nr:AbrB/MazE/SpoVT family DNA-binding domain-containing protein [Nitrososphaerota archaeon]
MTAQVTRTGNSLSILIPADEVKTHQIKEGDVVEIEIVKKAKHQGSLRFCEIQKKRARNER